MLNNFIGGGQVFLHKVRMFKQVLKTTLVVSLLAGFCLAWSFGSLDKVKVDWDGAMTYAKAQVALKIHPAISAIAIGKSKANVDAYSNGKLWKKRMLASSVSTSNRFKSAWDGVIMALKSLMIKSLGFGVCAGSGVVLFWSRFGRNLKLEQKKEGNGEILTARQVRTKLKRMGKASDLYSGKNSINNFRPC